MKMRKQLFGVLLALLLCVTMAVPAFASSNTPRLVDNARLLTGSEQSELLDKLDEISQRQQVDIVVVTTDALNRKMSEAYADDFVPVSHDGTQGKAEIGKRLRRFLLPHILLRANPRRRRRKVLTKQNILRMSAYEYF